METCKKYIDMCESDQTRRNQTTYDRIMLVDSKLGAMGGVEASFFLARNDTPGMGEAL